LSDAEVAALKVGTVASLQSIDVHPIFRQHWLMMSDPEAVKYMDITEYLPTLKGTESHG
jgi:hypothetical protein